MTSRGKFPLANYPRRWVSFCCLTIYISIFFNFLVFQRVADYDAGGGDGEEPGGSRDPAWEAQRTVSTASGRCAEFLNACANKVDKGRGFFEDGICSNDWVRLIIFF